ncbi:MAG: choice-of-anchor D domain-containing protein [Ignavibacteriae bacterium]|nr:choice-of-anchor D domain-containing protein [Ignavibacteriota bacterium]
MKILISIISAIVIFSLHTSLHAGVSGNANARLDNRKQIEFSSSNEWMNFTKRHGAWSVQWNEVTGTPHRAFGDAIQIPGYRLISKENIQQAARDFLSSQQEVLKINPSELQFVRATPVNGRWYVSYRQTYHGLEVLFSEIELRIFSNGNVMAFGVDYFNNINVSTATTITYEQAKAIAVASVDFSNGVASGNDKVRILPVIAGTSVSYDLVYTVNVTSKDMLNDYLILVDAQSGNVVFSQNRVFDLDVNGRVHALVQPELPSDSAISKNLNDYYFIAGNDTVRTDSTGRFSFTPSLPTTFTATLQGPWVRVFRGDGQPDASLTYTVNPGDSLEILWDSSNSHLAERDAFYHINYVHDYITSLDTNFTAINFPVGCQVNAAGSCNAYAGPNGVTFLAAGGSCVNTGQMPSVIYHEYGHVINYNLYEQLGSYMFSTSAHEGTADINSAMIEDNPFIARGLRGPGTYLRSVSNTRKYPENITGGSHNDGLILAGAFWDVRVATSLPTARRLAHFAKYGLPDDINTGICYSEWYLETLVADDDDGNLGNGTPNFSAINSSFNAHGIGSSLFMRLSFSHNELTNTQDTVNAYSVNFSLAGVNNSGSPDSVIVYYSTDNFSSAQSVLATLVSPTNYHAEIPPQSAGTFVKYYITAYDPFASSTITIPSGAPSTKTFGFLVGFQQVLLHDFETESRWQVGAPGDNASRIWKRAQPQESYYYGYLFEPGDDHSANGSMCYISQTEAKTTLLSPVFDLDSLDTPVIQYYKWYQYFTWASTSDNWKVDISSDGGSTWVAVENTKSLTNGWEKVVFKVSDYVVPTDLVQIRFVASVHGNNYVESLMDDFEINGKSRLFLFYPSTPQLLSPNEGEITSELTVHFEWHVSKTAESFHLQFADDSVFSNILVDDSTITDTTYQYYSLTEGKTYYWRVEAKNVKGTSGFSPTRTFRTLLPAPDSLTSLLLPFQGVLLNWRDNSSTETNFLIVRKEIPTGEYAIIESIGQNQSSYFDSSVENGKTYQYRILAINAETMSDSSNEITIFVTSPEFAFTPSNLLFDSILVGTTQTIAVTISNAGGLPLFVSSLLTDTISFSISLQQDTIAPLSSEHIIVTFTPISEGVKEASIIFQHNAMSSTDTLRISGVGIFPHININRTSVSFGEVAVFTSKAETVTVRNTGTASLRIDSMKSDNSFFSVNPTSNQIQPADSAVFLITFSPISPDSQTGTVLLWHNASVAPETVLVTGKGITPVVEISPSTLDFGNVHASSLKIDSVTIRNIGTILLRVDSITSNNNQFTPLNVSASEIIPGDSEKLTIYFQPTSAGLKTGTIKLWHNGSGSPQAVPVVGVGTAPAFAVTPSSLDFGNVHVSSSKIDSVTVTNTGTEPLVISSTSSNYLQFSITPGSATIQASQSRKFTVTYTPNSLDGSTAQLSFFHNAVGSPSRISVTGTGTSAVFSASQSMLNFGSVALEESKIDSITITNIGNESLFISSVTTTNSQFTISPSSDSIAPTTFRRFMVTFTPASLGYQSAFILFTHNAAGSSTVLPVSGVGGTFTVSFPVMNKWNIISLPLSVDDASVSLLFPDAQSNAFSYLPSAGYMGNKMLVNRKGYWLKFSAEETVQLHGVPLAIDTFEVISGWNLIGSITFPIPTQNIISEPPNIAVSEFYGYNSGYQTADSIVPGRGYWVKSETDGQLILTSFNTLSLSNRIQIIPTSEVPPTPPGEIRSSERIPEKFSLEQNTPNPFNPSTMIRYQLPVGGRVSLKIYNVLGQEVTTLLDEIQDAGFKSQEWNAGSFASGVYFYRLTVQNGSRSSFTDVKKLMLLK